MGKATRPVYQTWEAPSCVGQPIVAAAGFLAGADRNVRQLRRSRLQRRLQARLPAPQSAAYASAASGCGAGSRSRRRKFWIEDFRDLVLGGFEMRLGLVITGFSDGSG